MTTANALYVIGFIVLTMAGCFSVIAFDIVDRIKGN
jgi:hypothetical protein